MKNAAVIGDPIGHSLSPALFSRLARLEGLPDFHYEARRVTEKELPEFFQAAKSELIGFNVTIPHKEDVIPFLNKVSPSAQAIGAVNVVSFSKDLSEGHNTDVSGFSECLVENNLSLKGKKVLILGAGGAAKAVAFALGDHHCKNVTILNKTLSRAQKLIEAMKPHFPETTFEAFSHLGEIKGPGEFNLIVNSTPMGMDGILFTNQNKEFFQDVLATCSSSKTVVFDLIYRPEETPLLQMAKEQGSQTIGGLSMLINQALSTWEIWIGPLKNKNADKTDLKEFLKKTVAASKNSKAIFLTGFMAVGKSTVGKLLARSLGWNFVDTDSLVEKKAGKTIPEIFAGQGEVEFRKLEQKVIEELSHLKSTVVALGGGALMKEESLKSIKESGYLVYLSATTENLVARLKGTQDIRPLLKQNTGDITSVVASMFSARQGQYQKADTTVSTDKLQVDQVVEKIIFLMGESGDS